MTAENRQPYHRNSESKTEIQRFLLEREIRLVPSGSAAAQYTEIFGTQNLELDILPPNYVVSISKKFPVHNPPLRHSGSGALYYIDEHETPDGHVIYLSKLDPHSVTSRHKHPHPMREFYFLLHGEAFQGEEPMEQRSVINPFEYHQVTTGEKPALLLIFMENGASVPKHLRHQP